MRKKLQLLFAILAMAVSASAYSFEVDGIYYNILSDGTSVEVTSGDSKYSGSVTIPESVEYNSTTYSVTSIGKDAFYLSSLTSVNIPESVTSIGDDAFFYCTDLTSFTGKFASSDNRCLIKDKQLIAFAPGGLTSYEIPNTVTSIGESAFRPYTNLTSITIPNTVTSIGTYAFNTCTGLTSITIPNSVTSIEFAAFQGCSCLTSVTIGNSVETIGINAFADCMNLAEIISLRTTPPGLGTMCFNNVTKTTCKVIVPSSAVSAYQDATGWSAFKVDESNSNITAGYIYTDDIPYKNSNEVTGCNAYYIRNFTHTGWQALFLPFAMSYDDWKDKGTVAQLTGVSEGVLQWETIESEDSSTVAGKPYIFKPNAAGNVTFSVSNATLESCTDTTPVSYTDNGTYTLNGTYTEKTDMADTKAYALSNGNFYYTTDNNKTLKPYRIFLTVPESVYAKKAPIRSSINGEGTTEIEGIDVDFDFDADSHQQINLFGQPVGNDYKGIVIVNGKKIIRR